MKVILLGLLGATFVPGSERATGIQSIHAACPIMQSEASGLNERGEVGMGFSQTATAHHFYLTTTGGVIQVEAKDTSDADDVANIRMHLSHIATAFQQGDFDIPMFVHDTVPLGEPEMKRLRTKIHYTLEESATGGRVVLSSTDKKAIAAIHKFLIFQIQEHQTGDPIQVQ
jgi:hypothetical protein